MKIQITENKVIDVTPQILAQIFFEMDSNQQREFFENVAELFGDAYLDVQMEHVALDISEAGKEAMLAIGRAAI